MVAVTIIRINMFTHRTGNAPVVADTGCRGGEGLRGREGRVTGDIEVTVRRGNTERWDKGNIRYMNGEKGQEREGRKRSRE